MFEPKNSLERLWKVEDHLEKMGELGGVDQKCQYFTDVQLDEIDAAKRDINKKFVAYQQRNYKNSRWQLNEMKKM